MSWFNQFYVAQPTNLSGVTWYTWLSLSSTPRSILPKTGLVTGWSIHFLLLELSDSDWVGWRSPWLQARLEKMWEVLTRLVEVVSRNQTPLSLTAFYQPMSNRLECIPGQHPPWFDGWKLPCSKSCDLISTVISSCTGQLNEWPFYWLIN